jgi:hypothetical protein
MCAIAFALAATIVSVTAQQCDYSFKMPELIHSLSQRAYAEAEDDDYESACETMRDVIALYNEQIQAFKNCGDLTSAINTQTNARSAAKLARTYCKNAN